MEEIMAKEHELLSLGGQAAAAAHSLGTPFSTIKIISADLLKQFSDNLEIKKDIELLATQIDRCGEILKKLTLNPMIEDEFIDRDLSMYDYLMEIVKSFQEISEKEFIINSSQNLNSIYIMKSIEIVYGLRNFIGNANKFAKEKILVNRKRTDLFYLSCFPKNGREHILFLPIVRSAYQNIVINLVVIVGLIGRTQLQ